MNKEEIVKRFMATYEPDTFLKNKHGVYLYYSQNGVSGINLESFFEDLVEYVLDQQTEQLKKEIEYLKRVNSRQSETIEKGIQNYIEQIEELTLLGASAEKQVIDLQSQLSEKDKELSELKAKHKEDVMNAFNDGKRADIYTRQDFENGKEYTYTTPEQYYTQTHGQ